MRPLAAVISVVAAIAMGCAAPRASRRDATRGSDASVETRTTAGDAGTDDTGGTIVIGAPDDADGERADDAAAGDADQATDDAADAATSETGLPATCLGVDKQTLDPAGGDCCFPLIATQSTTSGGAPLYTCTTCIAAGQATLDTFGLSCCPGLRSIPSGSGPTGTCVGGIDQRICSRCGNGICEDWERPCGCPADCGPADGVDAGGSSDEGFDEGFAFTP